MLIVSLAITAIINAAIRSLIIQMLYMGLESVSFSRANYIYNDRQTRPVGRLVSTHIFF